MTLLPALVLLITLTGGGTALAQTQGGRGGSNSGNGSTSAESTSKWARLPANQKAALQPLAAEWDNLDEAHRRKWMAMARNFDRISVQEQATLHSRMTEWASLSPRERVHARLNFAEVQRLAPEDERKAKWEAYQALSEAERKSLAEEAPPRRGTALPVRPVPRERLAPVPPAALQSGHGGPRIALTPPPPRTSPAANNPPSTESTATPSANALVPMPVPAEAAPSHPAESLSPDAPAPGRLAAP